MNILPKKSWHVRTKKNIERVHRDEAEAERLSRITEDRKLRAEQEARMRELRARAGLPETSETEKHFNLFDGCQDSQKIGNKEHEDEKRQNETKWEQRVGILNKLVRTEDVNQPWYCRSRPEAKSFSFQNTDENKSTKNNHNSDLIASIYDPMTAIKHAEQIVRRKRIEEREQIALRSQPNTQLQLYNYDFYKHVPPPPSYPISMMPTNQLSKVQPTKITVQIDESDSSPEIIREVKRSCKVSNKKDHPKRDKNKSRSHKKSSRHKHHRHKKHKKHKR